jgi:hypothetical protein
LNRIFAREELVELLRLLSLESFAFFAPRR